MEKVLGVDLGTDSIGWAIVQRHDTRYELLDRGVDIFQEGVARGDTGQEQPAVQQRTAARALRRHYARRRLRKIELLKVLVRHELCPPLTEEQLEEWKRRKVYPLTDEFLRWQRTDDRTDRNPYRDRYRALTETLDLATQHDRYALGRAFYHLAQRRGFRSNRKEAGADREEGKVKGAIRELSAEIADAGCAYAGIYFYELYRRGERIRTRYTSRTEHQLAEFEAICARQRLPDELCGALRRAIFFQRPLKSQKGLVGRCTFEKRKSRCAASHPRFEEFRMRSYVNNIRIETPADPAPRPLYPEEIEAIAPLFQRKSRPHFDFEDIAKKLAGKGRYACKGDRIEAPYRFNFARKATVSGSPVTAALAGLVGDDWLRELCRRYALGAGKSEERILDDVWHALFSFDDDERLRAWAKERLGLDDDEAARFAAIRLPQGYAALSLNAIRKILPALRAGYRYDDAVFIANLKAVLPPAIRADEAQRSAIEADIAALLDDYRSNPLNRATKEECIRDYLRDRIGSDESRLRRLYHPSMIETYPAARPDAQGGIRLGSPRTPAVRNPMAMRALHRLRALVNALLRDGKIDPRTKIRIECARELNDANRRKALESYQRQREAEHRKYADEIRAQFAEATGRAVEPTQEDVLKYRLWEEQKHICLYTGRQIGIADFIGDAPRFDIEHTVPRSRGGDDAQENKTLCESRFNRETKRAKLPAELADHAAIAARIEALGWPERIERLRTQLEFQYRKSRQATTKQEKDAAIQRRHCLRMELDYWQAKLERFRMTELPEGFTNRQGVDIGIIGKYARAYLGTVFERIYTVKGTTTAAFRRMWGLQQERTPKARTNHAHHCIDAIVIACIGPREYDLWARYAGDTERYERGEAGRPRCEKPWPTFTEDVRTLTDELLIAHHTADNMVKQSRKRLYKHGKALCDEAGNPRYAQGDTARGALHKQTFYGAILRDDEVQYVVRKPLDQLQKDDVEKIVDEAVKQRVKEAIAEAGFKTATDPAQYTVWMNREKGIPIRKVRIFATTVKRPLRLKEQRDASVHPHKRHYYAVNDANYCMALYEGTNERGRTERSFEVVNRLEAAAFFKASADRASRPDLVPCRDAKSYPLKYILKPGTMVLFYENTPEELGECTPAELAKRLYKVTGISTTLIGQKYAYGVLTLKHHQEARPSGELKIKKGSWKIGEEYRPLIGMNHTQLNACVEGYDFELTVTGKIRFKH